MGVTCAPQSMKLCWAKQEGNTQDDDVQGSSGPQNVLTVRSMTHIPRSQQSSTQSKNERAPPSLGNNHWSVANWHNSIRTSQYSWWNFLFLDLLQQVIIPANAYFIAMAILQTIPAICQSHSCTTSPSTIPHRLLLTFYQCLFLSRLS